MPLYYVPGKRGPEKKANICQFSLDNLITRNPLNINSTHSNHCKPIEVPDEYDIENGLTGMNSSVNIKIMKHIGYDGTKIRSV
jgi:hypothetical protein